LSSDPPAGEANQSISAAIEASAVAMEKLVTRSKGAARTSTILSITAVIALAAAGAFSWFAYDTHKGSFILAAMACFLATAIFTVMAVSCNGQLVYSIQALGRAAQDSMEQMRTVRNLIDTGEVTAVPAQVVVPHPQISRDAAALQDWITGMVACTFLAAVATTDGTVRMLLAIAIVAGGAALTDVQDIRRACARRW
jgi:hypothetical protein